MEKNFNAREIESKWYKKWQDGGYFKSEKNDKPSYTIVIPPPNVTGILHMGHVLNNSLQDFFIRKAKKEGYNALWVPGTDHASIATEAKVVGMLRERGIKKSELTREAFLEYCWEWKEKYGGIIIEQLKAIGAAADWDRTTFTMDDHYYKAVVRVFVDLYNKGYIYRGLRIINWDCEAKTALSNEEVLYKEEGEISSLYYVQYQVVDSDERLTVATTRPETIFGDTAICINPKDSRYQHLVSKKVLVPLIHREIPIILDDYVDMEFGTGCLKVTPAHDPNDYEISQRHPIEVRDILNDDGTLNEQCDYPSFVGKDRFEVKKQMRALLESEGALVKVEQITNKVGRSERTNTVVEPKLSMQWYIDMKKISKKALDAVMDDEVMLYPSFYKNTYRHWMENVRDWCISRQLWWGHRIPAYTLPNGEIVVAETIEGALINAQKQNPSYTIQDLKQDEDVLDTWASSWLWPIEVFKGFDDSCFDTEKGKINVQKNEELSYYVPTQTLVTAPEILFFWVARMIIASYEYTDQKPFEKVFLTGIVRDHLGRKMSKSLGNSPDLFELIEKYGVDGVRYGMMSLAPAGNDIFFDEKSLEVGRNFSNKLWNALRLVKGWEVYEGKNEENVPVIDWYEHKWQKMVNEAHKDIDEMKISEALKNTYSFIWDDFCSWYLELIKPEYQKPIDRYTLDKTMSFFENICSILHPVMPFITEEIWSHLKERKEGDLCIISPYPARDTYSEEHIEKTNLALQFIIKNRDIRAQLKLKNIEKIEIAMDISLYQRIESLLPKIVKMLAVSHIETTIDEQRPNATSAQLNNMNWKVYSEKEINIEDQKQKINEEITYIQGFIRSIESKLNNENFVKGAPEKVVLIEKKKLEDGQNKLRNLLDSLNSLK